MAGLFYDLPAGNERVNVHARGAPTWEGYYGVVMTTAFKVGSD